jgi:hypothetical protein
MMVLSPSLNEAANALTEISDGGRDEFGGVTERAASFFRSAANLSCHIAAIGEEVGGASSEIVVAMRRCV